MMGKKVKKVLILGGKGMLGNALVRYLTSQVGFDCTYTVSNNPENGREKLFSLKQESCIYDVLELLSEKYDYVVNCIGVIRPNDDIDAIRNTFFVNSYFPHILAHMASQEYTRVIHVSTDCVFTGLRGNYSENDIPDETSVYGVSKFLGEIRQPPHITLRTSIIGRELGTKRNLLDWFLSNSDDSSVKGFTNVFWNGVTTLTLAKIIKKIIAEDLLLQGGLFQFASERISKYDLLRLANEVFNRNINIVPDITQNSDKTIISSREVIPHFGEFLLPLHEQLKELSEFYKDSSEI